LIPCTIWDLNVNSGLISLDEQGKGSEPFSVVASSILVNGRDLRAGKFPMRGFVYGITFEKRDFVCQWDVNITGKGFRVFESPKKFGR